MWHCQLSVCKDLTSLFVVVSVFILFSVPLLIILFFSPQKLQNLNPISLVSMFYTSIANDHRVHFTLHFPPCSHRFSPTSSPSQYIWKCDNLNRITDLKEYFTHKITICISISHRVTLKTFLSCLHGERRIRNWSKSLMNWSKWCSLFQRCFPATRHLARFQNEISPWARLLP